MSDDLLDSLLSAWQEHRLRGRDVPASELCRDCPELTDVLSRRIRALDKTDPSPNARATPAERATLDLAARSAQTGSSAQDLTPPPGNFVAPTAPSSTLIPGYEILGELGRGGMGVVYKARQISLKRTVALKVILAGAHAGPESIARFLREAETIARLRHPNVVQVYDYGTRDGTPYFSLEYVELGSLADQFRGQPQPAKKAAHTVEVLARAIEAAHGQGIVHRDLKPGNVLVAADGTLKISDFGLAKYGDSAMTATGEVLGTPSYMAPEQAQGKPHEVGSPADVYALGAILYELVTGRPPFRGASAWETVQLVTHAEPVAPSQLQPRLPRDVDTICLKCLQKEPARRYASAGALADDLRRFQADEPILARPVGRLERAWRWCRRQPLVAGLLAGLVLAVIVGFAGVTVSWLRAERHRKQAVANLDEANRQRDQAVKGFREARDAVDKFLTAVSQHELFQKPGMYPLRKKLLEQARGFYQSFVRDHADDPGLKEDLADALRLLASITRDVGSDTEALKLFQEAVAANQRLRPEEADPQRVTYNLARVWGELGLLHVHLDHDDEAGAAFREETRCWEELHAARPDDVEYKEGLAVACNHLGLVYRRANQLPEAEAVLRRGAGIWDELIAANPDRPSFQDFLSWCQMHLGLVYERMHQPARAEPAFDKMMALRRRLAEQYPDNADYQKQYAGGFVMLAEFYQERDPSKAESAARQAVTLAEKVVRDNPKTTQFLRTLLDSERMLASILADRPQREAALEWYGKAIQAGNQILKQVPDDRWARDMLPALYAERADVLDDLGRYREAIRDWDQAVALEKGPEQASHRMSRALSLAHAGDHARAVAEADVVVGAKDVTGLNLYNAACVYALAAAAGRSRQAESYAAHAVELLGRARAAGYFRDAGHRATLQKDKDLAALRGRADFQKLVAAIAPPGRN